MKMKYILTNAFGLRVMDAEADVRREAYLRLNALNIKLQDFESVDTKLFILKEGMTEQDPRAKNACLKFLRKSIVSEVKFEVQLNKLV
jgi:hypothetical protein